MDGGDPFDLTASIYILEYSITPFTLMPLVDIYAPSRIPSCLLTYIPLMSNDIYAPHAQEAQFIHKLGLGQKMV